MDHPDIKHMRMYGTDPHEKEPMILCEDSLDRTVYSGDEIYVYEDWLFLVEELPQDAQDILEIIGASKEIVF